MKEKKSKQPQKNKRRINNQMSVKRHFDSVAVLMAPSILENKLNRFWSVRKIIFRISASATVALSMAAVLATTNKFEDTLGMPGERWGAIFSIAFFISLAFFIIDVIYIIVDWKNGKLMTTKGFIDELINNAS